MVSSCGVECAVSTLLAREFMDRFEGARPRSWRRRRGCDRGFDVVALLVVVVEDRWAARREVMVSARKAS